MNRMHKAGGYAALIQGLVFVALGVIIVTVDIPQGLGPGADPAKWIAVAAMSPTPFLIYYLLIILLGVSIILSTLALRERMQNGAPNRMRLAVIMVSISSALFIANGVIGFTGFPPIVGLADTASAVTAFRAFSAVTDGLLLAGIFAAGLNLLLTGWAALSTRGLPAPLSYLLLLAGVFAVFSFVSPILSFIGPVLNIFWSLWVGYVLLAKPMSAGGLPRPMKK